MGKALAEEALHAGYKVEFISGPVAKENLPALNPDQIHKVTGAEEMLTTAQSLFENADIIIFAAAVSDYTPTETETEKMDKTSDERVLRLRPTPDIAKTLGHQKREHQITIGFALQTSNGDTHARRKLKATRELLGFMGIDPRRFQISWVSAAEGAKWAEVANQITDLATELGPFRNFTTIGTTVGADD